MPPTELSKQIAAFCGRLAELPSGDQARLRRSVGRPLAEATEALSLFYRLLPDQVPIYHEDKFFLVATLSTLGASGGKGNMGALLARARNPRNAKGMDRRMTALLDASDAQLAYRLQQAVRYLQSGRIPVDWFRLLTDLLCWDHPDHFVQRDWARSYYAPDLTDRPNDASDDHANDEQEGV